MRLLVVDDSKTMQRIISNVVMSLGYSVDTASDGIIGLNKFIKQHYDVVLTDINMPNMNGFELISEIRKRDTLIPIIVISTEGGKSEIIKALRLGCSNYIVKPFKAEVLQRKLKDIYD